MNQPEQPRVECTRVAEFRKAWQKFHAMKATNRRRFGFSFLSRKPDPADKQAEIDRLYELAERFEMELIRLRSELKQLKAGSQEPITTKTN